LIESGRIGDVTHIRFSNPPVNALSVAGGLVDALGSAIQHALADPGTKAIVIGSEGKWFSAGADIADFDIRDDALDRMRWLTSEVIENAAKPIVAAIHGQALGGGLELALAAHYRVCAEDTKFALPEIKLGLLPGAGGTQRLPRLTGTNFALEMMLSGNAIGADLALKKGLVDLVARGELFQRAIQFAQANIALGPRPTREMKGFDNGDGRPDLPKPGRGAPNQAAAFILQCAEAASTTSFAQGMALEKELFEKLRASEASKGLRHVFFSRRMVARIPGQPGSLTAPPIKSVAVIGAGLMGTGIATALLGAGLAVELIEPQAETIQKSMQTIRGTLQRDVDKGRLSQDAASERLALLSPDKSMAAVAAVDLVIEAVFEELEVKRQVFSQADKNAKPSAILATNTSTLDLNTIASFTGRPDRVVGLHFFSPANVMKLVEIVRGEKTSRETLASAMAFVKAIGKIGVVCGVCDGFIGNRMFEEYLRQAYFLLEEGALPQQVDGALEDFGMAMGPFRTMDLAGQDIGWSIRKRRAVEQPDRPYSKIPDLVCELGRYGQKTGAGFYLYPDGRSPKPDPFIDTLVEGYSKNLGTLRRRIEDSEVVDRCILALVNEGAKILGERIAYRAADIDVVYVDGYGFPQTRGGPMFFADRLGLQKVLAKIDRFRDGINGWAWSPAPLLIQLAQEGKTLGSAFDDQIAARSV